MTTHQVTISRLQPNGEPLPFTITMPEPCLAPPATKYHWTRPADDPQYRSVVAHQVKPLW